MYLARTNIHGRTHYVIRQSYPDGGGMRSRDLVDLGPDPRQYIVYVGGSGYYYHEELTDALARVGVDADQDQLDDLLFDFLEPRIQRIIHGFDRGRHKSKTKFIAQDQEMGRHPHRFDKRRYHYLRFGHSDQRYIDRVSEKLFQPLYHKSRDELEQYFQSQERILRHHEMPHYISIIFELNRFTPRPDLDLALIDQMDDFFVSRLCRLNEDRDFWSGMPPHDRLHDYFTRYAVMYFDYDPPRRSPWQAYVEEFINRHRIYHPPDKVKFKLEEAGRLFGLPWKELKRLDKSSLSRLYRQLALKYHPDQGGDADRFRRLTQIYKVLLKRR